MFEDDEELKKLNSESESAADKKAYLKLAGGIFQNLSDAPMASEIYYKRNSPKANVSGMFDAAAESIKDPGDRASKAQAYLKMKREGRAGAREEQVASAEQDPSSPDSLAMAEQISGVFPQYAQFVKGKSKAQIRELMPILSKKIEGDTQRENARISAGQRSQDRADMYNMRKLDKQDEKDEKKKAQMFEIEDRRQNINSNLDSVSNMIRDKGTWEALGSHNQDMDRLIEQVATDMAKLQDPGSVARPNEVEAVKKNLVQSGFANSNETALNIIANFKKEVAQRADGAYKVRGLDAPQGERKIVKQERNKKTGEMRVTYSDGRTEIISSTAGR